MITSMNRHLRQHVAAWLLLVPGTVAVVAFPATVLAQAATPEVSSVQVRTDAGLQPGARLLFRVSGTPGARAVVRIAGIPTRIELREVARGTYIGRYVLKRSDRVDDNAEVRALLRVGNRTGTSDYTLAQVMSGSAPTAVAPPPVQVAPAPLRIERFTVAPLERIEPGTELRFALDGVPGASVVVDLPGITNNLALREVRPGRYEGAYTLRRVDNLNLARPVVATLRAGDRTVTASVAMATAAAQPQAAVVPVNLPLQILSHPNNSQVAGSPVVVQGRTAAFASVAARVDVAAPVPGGFSVAQQLLSQTVQADGNGNFSFSFSPKFIIPGARYEVSLVATKANAKTEARLALQQR